MTGSVRRRPSIVAALLVLAVAVVAPSSRAQSQIPRPEHPNPQMQRDQWLNLNGTWEFWEGDACDEAAALARKEFPDRIVVPFCRESRLSGLARTGFVKNVEYRRTFVVPKEWNVACAEGAATGSNESTSGAASKSAETASGGVDVVASRGRVLLHVGACDWRTVVWVNGKRVAFHEGGSAPITCDVTDALRSGGNELRVWAFDNTCSKLQQCGKQCDRDQSYGCLYTRTTGIWQTVWIERVGSAYVDQLVTRSRFDPHDLAFDTKSLPAALTPLPTASISVEPLVRGDRFDGVAVVELFAAGKSVVKKWRKVVGTDASVALDVPNYRMWKLDDPFLYDVEVTLRSRAASNETEFLVGRFTLEQSYPVVVDRLRSYLGIRSVETNGKAVLLDGSPVFQRLILDQGFYPDGIWTAPSDEELKHDVERCIAAGFNGARLHQKCFEPRFHYWADKLGYLTWGEAPSWGNDDANPNTHRVVIQEWSEILARDRNHPSIVGWCPFNETGGGSGPLQNAVCTVTRAVDPTRLLLDTSGYTHSWSPRDVDDAHDYDQNPVSYRARWWPNALAASMPARYGDGAAASSRGSRPFFVSEFGGIAWIAPDERNGKNWGYGDAPKSEAEWFARFQGLCDAQLDNPSLFGFCYTQLTDVEQERNGLYYYDRRPKFDVAKLRAIVAQPAAIEAPVSSLAAESTTNAPRPDEWRVVLPSALDDPQRSWVYVASDVKLDEKVWRKWELGAPDDASKSNTANARAATPAVQAGRPGFGHKEGFPVVVGTPWTQKELYLFRLFEWDGAPFRAAMLVTHHDEDVTICLNGEELFHRSGWNDRYEPFDVTERARALLRKGTNEITVHVSQTGGGQYFDAALLVAPTDAKSPASGGSK